RQGGQALDGLEGVLKVVQDPEEQHDVELSEGIELHRHEVTDDAFDAIAQGTVGGVEALLSEESIGVPEPRNLVVRLRDPSLLPALAPVTLLRGQVEEP